MKRLKSIFPLVCASLAIAIAFVDVVGATALVNDGRLSRPGAAFSGARAGKRTKSGGEPA